MKKKENFKNFAEILHKYVNKNANFKDILS